MRPVTRGRLLGNHAGPITIFENISLQSPQAVYLLCSPGSVALMKSLFANTPDQIMPSITLSYSYIKCAQIIFEIAKAKQTLH